MTLTWQLKVVGLSSGPAKSKNFNDTYIHSSYIYFLSFFRIFLHFGWQIKVQVAINAVLGLK